MKNTMYVLLLLAALLTLFIAGCTQQQPAQPTPVPTQATVVVPATTTNPDTVRLMDTTLGRILTDSKGMSLYYFVTDIPGSGASTCYTAANCTHFWPIFSVDTIVVSRPLAASDFSSITRTDGSKQTAYRGWPLYYFLNDINPGDVKGENVLRAWYVAKPDDSVMIESTPQLGLFLTDGTGKTLYSFAKDSPTTTACSGTCLEKWPAFDAGTVSAPSVLKPADFSTVQRTDGIKQTAYMNHLLYYFADDTKPGDTKGNGFNNVWWVANVTGFVPPVPTPVPTTIPTTIPTIDTSSDGDGGGGGY